MSINQYDIIAFLSILFIIQVNCDLPSHCLVSDLIGKWNFYKDANDFKPSLKDHRTTCGHGFPNKVTQTIGDQLIPPFQQAKKVSFTLKKDYKVYKHNIQVGTWTPIYNQSFVIYYHNHIITASFKYYLSVSDNTTYETNCGKTMLGWVIKDKNKLDEGWSCVYGIKAEEGQSFVKKMHNSFIQKEVEEKGIRKGNSNLLNQVKSDDLKEMINEINEANLTWKAKLYEDYKGLTIMQLREKIGINHINKTASLSLNKPIIHQRATLKSKKAMSMSLIETRRSNSNSPNDDLVSSYANFKKIMKDKANANETSSSIDTNTTALPNQLEGAMPKKTKEPDSEYVTDLAEVKKYLNTSIDDIDESILPDNWDWRNVGSINYITPVEFQGQCGSCYVFSAVHSLESRLRIQTDNKDKTRFSIQFPLSCNFYSEGCKGGYPYLVAKFFSEFELVPRSCFPYTQSTSQCHKVCDYTKLPKKYQVSQYGYLGGYYGATSEVMMMKEIRARGPIPGNIKIPIALNYYASGIFSMKELKKNSDKLNKTRMVDRNLSFEIVEHSITLIGYGVENGIKYWIGKNTWGDFWGEKGYFRLLRGENELNIESMGDFFNIKVTDRN